MKKAIGCPFCDKTTPKPNPEALVSTIEGKDRSSKANTRIMVMANFNCSKATIASLFHLKEFFYRTLVSGATISPYPLTNLL